MVMVMVIVIVIMILENGNQSYIEPLLTPDQATFKGLTSTILFKPFHNSMKQVTFSPSIWKLSLKYQTNPSGLPSGQVMSYNGLITDFS